MEETPRRVRTDVTSRAAEDTRGDTAGDSGDVGERTREIRSEIEETRVELTETIDAIQEKLKPRNVVASATDRVKSAATERVREMADTASQTAQQAMDYTRDVASGMTERAREYPLPLALVGVGAAWWLLARRPSYRREGYRMRQDQRDYGRGWTRDETRYNDVGEHGLVARIRNNPMPAALACIGLSWLAFSSGESDDGDYTTSWRDQPREGSWPGQSEPTTGEGGIAQNLSESASQMASRTREYASETTDSMRRMVQRRRNQVERMVHENPLLVGAGALMLGAAFGMAVPETDTEREWMGEARDNMVGRARDMARDAATQMENAATTVADAAGKIAGKSQQ
jgi:ElaB/YqjD/DUF883 family membrane-anchored ribosome-binding protein